MTRLRIFALWGGMTLAAAAAGAAQTTFSACYVPGVGALYLIKRSGLPGACLATPHTEITWGSSGAIADGSVTTAKLADGAVTTAKIAPGTSVELLDGLAASAFARIAHTHDDLYAALLHDHDARYFTRSELQGAGTINQTGNPVDWSKLRNVPSGFADGVDNDGGTGSDLVCFKCVGVGEIGDAVIFSPQLAPHAVATDNLVDGAVTTVKLYPGSVTEDKLGFDPATQAELDNLAVFDGTTPNAGVDRVHWSVLGGVPPGFVDGVDDGAFYTAGAGLALSGTTFAVAPNGVSSAMLAGDAASLAKVSGGALVNASGSIGIGTAAPASTLDVNGGVTVRGELHVGAGGMAPNGAGFKHRRLDLGTISGGVSQNVLVSWSSSFADASYTATCTIQEKIPGTVATEGVYVRNINNVQPGFIVVQIENTSPSNRGAFIHCIAVHD